MCYLCYIPEYVNRGNTQGVDAMCREPCITRNISFRPDVGIMRCAINLNRQIGPRAEEIQHIGAGGMLLAEFMARWRCSQILP
jgi:hypothetical protein